MISACRSFLSDTNFLGTHMGEWFLVDRVLRILPSFQLLGKPGTALQGILGAKSRLTKHYDKTFRPHFSCVCLYISHVSFSCSRDPDSILLMLLNTTSPETLLCSCTHGYLCLPEQNLDITLIPIFLDQERSLEANI